MRKFLLCLLAFSGLAAAAASPGDALQLNPTAPLAITAPASAADSLSLRAVPQSELDLRAAKAPSLRSDLSWSEWTSIGTTSFPDYLVEYWKTVCAQDGNVMPDFNQPFTVMYREASDASGQMMFQDIFNHVDIIFDVDPYGVVTCEPQSTGVATGFGDSGWYNEYMFMASGLFLKESGSFYLNSPFLLVYGNMGYSTNSATWMKLSGHKFFTFFVNDSSVYQYLPAASPVAKTSVTFYDEDNIGFYRVIPADNGSITLKQLAGYMRRTPSADVPYRYYDVTEKEFDLPVDKPVTRVFYIPFDADSHRPLTFTSSYVYYNHPTGGEWKPLGKGVLRTAAIYNHIAFDTYDEQTEYMASLTGPVVIPVDVETRVDNPSVFRVKNPFADRSILPSKLLYNGFDGLDDIYMVFDAIDPSRVLMEPRWLNTGYLNLSGSSVYNYLDRYTIPEIDAAYGNLWGKYADNRIVMPQGSAYGWGTNWDDYILELPGYVDYTCTPVGSSETPDGNFSVGFRDVPESVTSITCGLVPVEEYEANIYFPERYAARLAYGDASLKTKTVEVGAPVSRSGVSVEIPFSPEEIGYGSWVAVAVTRDAQGNSHNAMWGARIERTAPLDKWEKVATVQVYDSTPMVLFTGNYVAEIPQTDIFKSPGQEIYYLPDYFRQWAQAAGLARYFNEEKADKYFINAVNPSQVFVTSNPDGSLCDDPICTGLEVHTDYEAVCLLNSCNLGGTIYGDATSEITPDGQSRLLSITFRDNALLSALYDHEGNLSAVQGGLTSFDFQYDDSSVESVGADAGNDAPVEYYNLQGMKVSNPASGIFIRRQGSRTEKVVIRCPPDKTIHPVVGLPRPTHQ